MKCYQLAFLSEEMLSATRVGDSVSSLRNCETDSGYKTRNDHLQQFQPFLWLASNWQQFLGNLQKPTSQLGKPVSLAASCLVLTFWKMSKLLLKM